MEIKSLSKTDFDTLYKAFSLAFADYDFPINNVQLSAMLKRRGYNGGLSFAMFDGKEIVSFILNGIGNFNGIPTAYDTGTGTLPEYRGKGLVTKIFEYSLPYLGEMKIEQYLLEVLQHNTKAVSVYRNIGFVTIRELNYYTQKNEDINNQIKTQNISIKHLIKAIDIEKHDFIPGFWDFYPSWQNSNESIRRAAGGFICLGAFAGDKLLGYCVFEPASGDLTQIAVDKQNRRKGIGSLLLGEIIKLNRTDSVRIVNTDTSCESINGFLKAKNIDADGKQFEMIKKL